MTEPLAIAIIPARGGSKRIPGKNIKPFCGKPIIAYSIACAQATGIFDRIVVSTDSDEIMRVAEDHVLEQAVVAALRDGPFSYFCCIYPTAVFMRAEDLRAGYDLIRQHDTISVFPVTSFAAPIFRGFQLRDDGGVEFIWPEHRDTRSNDLPEAYHDAGQFYWLRTTRFLEEKVIYGPGSLPLILPRHRVHDIDPPEDWEQAERAYRAAAPDE